MSWNDDRENYLYIDKRPCPKCGGDYAMVYEPYENKNGSRICGFICVDCGHAETKDSQQLFALYTGKNKTDVWDLDNDYDIEDFHPDAQRVIRDMKSGRYFKPPKPKRVSQPKPKPQPQLQPRKPVYQTQKPVYPQPKPTVQKPIYYQPPQEVIRRPFIDYDVDEYGNATDFNRDFESKDYRKTVGNYRNKRAKGYSLNAIELFRLAYSLCEIKQHHEAVKEWTTYILRFPNDSDLATAYNNRGVNYSKINEINKSTEDYKMAIKLGYSDSEKLREIIKNRESISMLETAKRYYSNKDYKNAVELYEKTISNGYDLGSYWFSYAYSLFELNKFDESVNAYTEFIDKNPDSSDIPAAYNNRAVGLFKLHKNYGGFEDYWEAFSKYPSDEKKNAVLSRIYSRSKQCDDIEQFEKALLKQRDIGISDEVDAGKFYINKKMYEKAIECFGKSYTSEAKELLEKCKKELFKEKVNNGMDDFFILM
jgi:tetratricopeptide (TPR) repeat protein